MILSSRLQAKPAVLSRIQDKVSTWLGKAASRIEGRVPVFIAILLALYLWVLKSERIKPLWHDELYTYYIAQAHTFSQMMTWIRTIDLNPPLYYIAARLVFHVVQPSKAAVRIPSIVAYFVAVISVYQLVRRRFTPLYGFIGALVLLGSSFNVYSYEARPYAMVLAFMGILSLGWQRAIEEDRSRSWIALLFVVVGGFGMLLSHVLALVAYAALLLTEFIRFLLCRKPDWILWICLLLPLSACVTYFGPIQNHDAGAFPAVYQASIVKLLSAYSDIWIGIASLFATGAVAIILLIPEKLPANNNKKYGFSLPEIILALGFCCVPLVITLVFMHSHSEYSPRYGMAAIFGAAILVPWLIAQWTGTSSRAALVCSFIFLFGVITPSSIARHLQNVIQPQNTSSILTGESTVSLAQVMPELPLVDASGLTFLEMNSRENSAFLSRVYYLTDRRAAIRYANATIFEGLPSLIGKFPIYGDIMPYQKFVQQHTTFLVLGTYSYPEDWLLRKLLADHATLRFLGKFPSDYKDQDLYEVTLAHP